jgi:hypothetical protein
MQKLLKRKHNLCESNLINTLMVSNGCPATTVHTPPNPPDKKYFTGFTDFFSDIFIQLLSTATQYPAPHSQTTPAIVQYDDNTQHCSYSVAQIKKSTAWQRRDTEKLQRLVRNLSALLAAGMAHWLLTKDPRGIDIGKAASCLITRVSSPVVPIHATLEKIAKFEIRQTN